MQQIQCMEKDAGEDIKIKLNCLGSEDKMLLGNNLTTSNSVWENYIISGHGNSVSGCNKVCLKNVC